MQRNGCEEIGERKDKWRSHLLSCQGDGLGVFVADDKITTSGTAISRGCTRRTGCEDGKANKCKGKAETRRQVRAACGVGTELRVRLKPAQRHLRVPSGTCGSPAAPARSLTPQIHLPLLISIFSSHCHELS